MQIATWNSQYGRDAKMRKQHQNADSHTKGLRLACSPPCAACLPLATPDPFSILTRRLCALGHWLHGQHQHLCLWSLGSGQWKAPAGARAGEGSGMSSLWSPVRWLFPTDLSLGADNAFVPCFSRPGEEQHCCQPQATVPSQVGFSAHTFVDGALIKLFSYSVGNGVFMQKPDQ